MSSAPPKADLELGPHNGSNREALAIADANGQLTLWGSPSRISFAEFSNPTELHDMPTPVTVHVGNREFHSPIDIDADIPLNAVGMPFYREPLFSHWPTDQVYDVGSPPTKVSLPIATRALVAYGLFLSQNSSIYNCLFSSSAYDPVPFDHTDGSRADFCQC